MIHKEYTSNEVYVYMNGSLLYKRWLGSHGMVFCDIWGHRPFTSKDVEVFRITGKMKK